MEYQFPDLGGNCAPAAGDSPAALFSGTVAILLSIPLLAVKSVQRVGSSGPPTVTHPAANLYREILSSGTGPTVIAVMAVLSVAFGWLIAGRLLRPLRAITATAMEISASNLSRRLRPGKRDDEFTRLGRTLNQLFATGPRGDGWPSRGQAGRKAGDRAGRRQPGASGEPDREPGGQRAAVQRARRLGSGNEGDGRRADPAFSVQQRPRVPPDQVDLLFEPFRRLGNSRTRRREGHGLGLAIVRAIATAHDAELAATARPGGGLDITVTFPRPQAQDSKHSLPEGRSVGSSW